MPTVHNFAYTGSVQSVVVPEGVEVAVLEVIGAQGGDVTYGGFGASVEATVSDLVPGETLYVVVGGTPVGYVAGYPDGGTPGTSTASRGGPGGGSTSIGRGSADPADRIIVGGAGGGRSPRSAYNNGGAGGYPDGADGIGASGEGGTQTAGGIVYFPGSFGQGGDSPNTGSTRSGGAGGGGWYGGAAGNNGSATNSSGGGGSSYYDAGLSAVTAESVGTNTGDGSATITFQDPAAVAEAETGMEATAEIISTRPRADQTAGRDRAYLWITGLDGEQIGVIR